MYAVKNIICTSSQNSLIAGIFGKETRALVPKPLYLAKALGARANAMDILKYLIIQYQIHSSNYSRL